MTEPVRLWRCSVCEKWSHAKAKPAHHERYIPATDATDIKPDEIPGMTLEVNGFRVLRDDPGWLTTDPEGEDHPGGYWVACGPFTEYVAQEVQHDAA